MLRYSRGPSIVIGTLRGVGGGGGGVGGFNAHNKDLVRLILILRKCSPLPPLNPPPALRVPMRLMFRV